MVMQDPDVGVVSKADLREALRVNRALLWTAEGDLTAKNERIENCRERIRDQEAMIRMWEELAESAPERVKKIRAKITQQEERLESWKDTTTVQTTGQWRESRIEMLLKQIENGGVDGQMAIVELTKLAKK